MADPTAQELWDAVTAERKGDATVGTTDATSLAADQAPAQAAATDPAAPPADASTTTDPVDPYEGLSPDVKAKLERFDKLDSEHKEALRLAREATGRVAALQSQFEKSRQAQPAAEAPSQTQILRAAKDPEKWSALKKDFPEWGEGIEAFVDARVGALAGSGMTAEQVQTLIASSVSDTTASLTAQFQQELVGFRYPEWQSVVKTDDFEKWFAAQKPEVQALAASPNGRDAVQMLDLFHTAKKTPAVRQQRKDVLQAAATSQRPGASPTAVKSYEDMTPTEQWDYLARERERKRLAEAA